MAYWDPELYGPTPRPRTDAGPGGGEFPGGDANQPQPGTPWYQNDPDQPVTGGPVMESPGAGASTSTTPPATGGGGTGTGAPPVTSTGQIAPYNPQSAPLNMFQGSYDWKPTVAWNPKWTTAEGVQMDALTKALQDPLWTPENIAAMKEVQKEQALSMAQQLGGEVNQRFAGMNRVPSGARQAALGDIDQQTAAEILAAYRDLDLGTRQQNAEYVLQASDALNSALGGQFGRQYDITRLGEGQRQFDLSHMLAVMDFLEKQRQFNEDLGYRYGALNLGATGL